MSQPSTSRLRRQAVGAVVGTVCAALLPGAAIAATHAGHSPGSHAVVASAEKGSTSVRGFNDNNLTIKAGRKVTDKVVVVPRAHREVLVQARSPRAKHFVTLSHGRSAANGTFKAVYSAPKAGDWQFRLVVRPSRARKGAVTGTRSVKALDLNAPGAVTAVQAAATTSTVRLTWANPKAKDFTGVTIRRAEGLTAPTTPNHGTGVTDTGRKDTTFTDTGLAVDTDYAYALFAHDKAGNVARVSISVRTQRDGVTGLEFTGVTHTSIALAWTNPIDDTFTGVTIRRADGGIAPVSATDGTAVAEVASPESTFVDTGLTPDQQYTYAVFAQDADHVAVGATLTVSTRAPGTDAVLRINPLHPSGDNVTVDTDLAFDASDSLAADGTTIAAWSIDYGDGNTDSFAAGPFDPIDLNTSHSYVGAGDRSVTLTVTDSDDNTATDTITLHVFTAPQVTVTPTVGPHGDVTFDISAVTPPGTAITSWQMQVSGDEMFMLPESGTPAGPPPASLVVPFASGSYTVDFEITNDAGAIVFAPTVVDLVVP